MKSKSQSISPTMLQATTTLIDNLIQSEPLLRYHQANQRLKADPTAASLLQSLSEFQSEMRRTQMKRSVPPQDIQKLRDLQRQVQTNPVILDFATAQQAAIEFVREVNQEISTQIGIDFASLTRRSGGC